MLDVLSKHFLVRAASMQMYVGLGGCLHMAPPWVVEQHMLAIILEILQFMEPQIVLLVQVGLV